MKLVDQNHTTLDAPISRYLPKGYLHRQNLFALNQPLVEDLVPAEVLKRITVRMLLTHSAGLPNWSPDGPLTLAFEPGTDWNYSGEGYVLLQKAVEAITGESLGRLAHQVLFSPLGMNHSSFILSTVVSEELVAGTAASGRPHQLRFPFAVASGSLYTTVGDYGAFMAAILDDNAMISRIVDGAVNVSRRLGLKWGLGWGVEQTSDATSLFHWGNNPGYRALAMASLRSRDAIVVFTNSERGMPVAKAIVQARLPGEHGALKFEMVG